nr:probable histone-lysine N-methyltransferase CG1716 [Onthophagus taurus]
MPPKRKRGGGAKNVTKSSPTKSPVQNLPKRVETKKEFVPKFTEIITRSKRRGKIDTTDVDSTNETNDTSLEANIQPKLDEVNPTNLDDSTISEENCSEKSELSQEENKTVESKDVSIIMDIDDSQDESVNEDEQEAIISKQLSNLEFEMSNVKVVKSQSLENEDEEMNEEKETVEYIDSLGSEIIIECVSDDVIPIAGEQEVCLESDAEVEEIKFGIGDVEGHNIEDGEVHEGVDEDLEEDVHQEIEEPIPEEEIEEENQGSEEIEEDVSEEAEIPVKSEEKIQPEIDQNEFEGTDGNLKNVDFKEEEIDYLKSQEIKKVAENMGENEEPNKEDIPRSIEDNLKELGLKEESTEIEDIEGKPREEYNKEYIKWLDAMKNNMDIDLISTEKSEESKSETTTEFSPDTKPDTKSKSEIKQKPPRSKPGPKPKTISKPPKVPKQPKKKQEKLPPNCNSESVRRSSRIKSIQTVQKQKSSKGHGVVKHKEESLEEISPPVEEKPIPEPPPKFVVPQEPQKPVKVKSRWRRSSELELGSNLNSKPNLVMEQPVCEPKLDANEILKKNAEEVQRRLKQFIHLKENLYLTERISCKEAKKMTCDCFLTEEEITSGEYGCGEDCLNRLLMIECGGLCAVGDRCTNKKFQKGEFAPCEVFCTEKKGLGIRAAANIPYGEFILEYVGEVLDPEEFEKRATEYSTDKNQHYYFMALRADAVIDATQKGNISRFINHSCDPNAETQKWTVNGELRIGFYSKRTILAGEEITFDYQFQRYGKEAQKCFCEASTCRGWLGEEPDDDDEDDEEEDEEDEEDDDQDTKSAIKDNEKTEEVEKLEEEKAEISGESDQIVKEEKVVKKKEKKKVLRPRRLPRKDIFEDADLDEEIENLTTTGLKNQAQTLKLSRLMVRAKEPGQRTKLLRVLRHGEFPCRRLFLDYHGLRLIHGWMTDAQHMVKENKKLESQRLEILQTLATLPIPNKTMLQDSKVLPTVQRWSKKMDEGATLDSDSNSPKLETENEIKIETKPDFVNISEVVKSVNENMEVSPVTFTEDKDGETKTLVPTEEPLPDYEVEIVALGLKLLDEWSVLKEVFRIPKKERIEQMKEHEREADRKYKAGLGLEQDLEKKYESRYGTIFKRKKKIFTTSDSKTKDDQMTVLEKYHRRKLFALQVEQQELERRRNQQEIWRQHEQRCMTMGTDPKFTAPFDPNQGLRNTMIWNPQISQWQNYPIPNTTPTNVYYPGVNQNVIPNQMPPQTNLPVFPGGQIPLNKLVQTPPPNIQNKSMYQQQQQQQPPQIMQYRPVFPTQPIPYQQPDLGGYQVGQNGKMIQPHMVVSKPPLPTLPYQENLIGQDDPSQVKFMGPIPPPVKLPPKWKCVKDKYGRPYYYHIHIRKPQWEPPELVAEDPEESSETSSSDTSSLSSDSSSEETDSDDEIDDARLMLQIKNKFKMMEANKAQDQTGDVEMQGDSKPGKEGKSLDSRLLEEILKDDAPVQAKKRRAGLVTEILISPRTEEDKLQFKEDVKRYKANKEKLKQQKEMLELSKRQLANKSSGKSASSKPQKKQKSSVKAKLKEMGDNESVKKIKESFRSNMAVIMVSILNPYRKSDCKEGRITNTDDFKHLARKLTHFVMLKELKHCQNIDDLTVTESVKSKAKEFVRKYMSKFGEMYQKPKDDPEF